jgi:hypothetical protein
VPSCPNSTTVVYASNLLFFLGRSAFIYLLLKGKWTCASGSLSSPPSPLSLPCDGVPGIAGALFKFTCRLPVYMYWICHSRASLSYAESFGQTRIHLYTSHFSPPTSHTPTNATYTPIDRIYFETVRRRHAIKYQHICLLSSLVSWRCGTHAISTKLIYTESPFLPQNPPPSPPTRRLPHLVEKYTLCNNLGEWIETTPARHAYIDGGTWSSVDISSFPYSPPQDKLSYAYKQQRVAANFPVCHLIFVFSLSENWRNKRWQVAGLVALGGETNRVNPPHQSCRITGWQSSIWRRVEANRA